jgi:putative tricarboxylic transport membrane protein
MYPFSRKSRSRVPAVRFCLVSAILLLAAGCGAASTANVIEYPSRDVEIMAPAEPGGDYDQTARLMQRAVTEGGVLEENVEVYNVPGHPGPSASPSS